MVVEGIRTRKEEYVMARHKIYNRSDKVITVRPEFGFLFHGRTELSYGCFEVRAPIRDIDVNRAITKLQRCHPDLKVVPGLGGFESV